MLRQFIETQFIER